MKKKNYLFMTTLVMSVLLISCGGKNEKKDGGATEITSSDSDVPLDQLNINAGFEFNDYTFKDIKRNDEKVNFTGVGVEKDQNDSILNRVEVKNGWLLRYTHRIKVTDKYITISDLTFDNSKVKEGFKYTISKVYPYSSTNGWEILSSLTKYKNGVEKDEWNISIGAHGSAYVNVVKNEIGETASSDQLLGTTLKFQNVKLVKTLVGSMDLTKEGEGQGYVFLCKKQEAFCEDDGEAPMIEKILKNLKIEVKGFDYWPYSI